MNQRYVRSQPAQRGRRALGIEIIEQSKKIRFAQNNKIAGAKNNRIFRRFVVPLGDTEKSDVAVLSEVEARRADEIPDVFDEQQIDAFEGKLVERLMDEGCIEVACGPRRDLQRRNAVGTDAHRIVVRLQIPFDDCNPISVAQRHDGGFEESRFSRARRGHEVDGEYAVAIEVLAVVRRSLVIRGKEVLQDIGDVDIAVRS